MPEPRATGSLPPDAAEQVRRYLAALLPPGEVEDAVAEVATDSGYWGDTDETEILTVAHAVLTSRLRVATEVEVLVLNEDVGLDVPGVAAVLGLSPVDVRRILDEALAAIADTDAATGSAVATTTRTAEADVPAAAAPAPRGPAPDDATRGGRSPVAPTPVARRRQRLLLVVAALGIALVAIVAAWVLGRDGGCQASAPVCVSASVLTDAVDATTGRPGMDQQSFSLDDDVTLWFAFERQVPDPGTLEVRWYREGVALYSTDVRLGAGDELNVSLVALWADEPGRYRVEVAADDRVLFTRDFRIEG